MTYGLNFRAHILILFTGKILFNGNDLPLLATRPVPSLRHRPAGTERYIYVIVLSGSCRVLLPNSLVSCNIWEYILIYTCLSVHAMRSYRARHSNPSLSALGNMFSFQGLFEALMALVCILLPSFAFTRDGRHGIFGHICRSETHSNSNRTCHLLGT